MRYIALILILTSLCFGARIEQGDTARHITFVAVDATDYVTRETSLTNVAVYYSIDGGTATAMTSPTATALDATNMPGVFKLAIDEAGMVTLASGVDESELTLHITATEMAPVTLSAEVYRNAANVSEWLGTACATPTVAGVPETDMTHKDGVANIVLETHVSVVDLEAGNYLCRLESTTGIEPGMLIEFPLNTTPALKHLAVVNYVGGGFVYFSPELPAPVALVAAVKVYNTSLPTAVRAGDYADFGLSQIKATIEAADLSSSTVGTAETIGSTGLAAINAEADTAISDAALATAAELAATDANVTLILADTAEMQGKLPTGTISDFNATDDTVAHVTLVDTTTTNTDMLNADDIWDEAGITAGGTSTAREILKRLYAWSCGKWIDKAGTASATQQILDAEDASTVIIELTSDKKTPYKTTTIVE